MPPKFYSYRIPHTSICISNPEYVIINYNPFKKLILATLKIKHSIVRIFISIEPTNKLKLLTLRQCMQFLFILLRRANYPRKRNENKRKYLAEKIAGAIQREDCYRLSRDALNARHNSALRLRYCNLGINCAMLMARWIAIAVYHVHTSESCIVFKGWYGSTILSWNAVIFFYEHCKRYAVRSLQKSIIRRVASLFAHRAARRAFREQRRRLSGSVVARAASLAAPLAVLAVFTRPDKIIASNRDYRVILCGPRQL